MQIIFLQKPAGRAAEHVGLRGRAVLLVGAGLEYGDGRQWIALEPHARIDAEHIQAAIEQRSPQ